MPESHLCVGAFGIDLDDGRSSHDCTLRFQLLAQSAIMDGMNSRQRKTLEAIFSDPVNGALEWDLVESLLVAVGCTRIEGKGAAITFMRDGEKVYFHRPHPRREALRYRVKDAREFLKRIGVTP